MKASGEALQVGLALLRNRSTNDAIETRSRRLHETTLGQCCIAIVFASQVLQRESYHDAAAVVVHRRGLVVI